MAPPSSSRLPSARETAAAATVLAMLGACLGWLLHTQALFSPAVDMQARVPAAPSPARAAPLDIVVSLPAGLRAMSAPEEFTAATLSDKIDGKAEVYLAAGVAGLRCQRFAIASVPESWLELFVYDMGKPSNAFSVFSSQRRPDVADLGLADYAYRAGNELALVQGPFYVEIIATDEKAPVTEAALALAKAYVGATPVSLHADARADDALFPRTGLVSGSVTLLSSDVFGSDNLKDVYVARFRDGSDEFTLFAARRGTPGEASDAASGLTRFFVNECGGKEVARPASPAGSVIIDSGGGFDAVFSSGVFLAGVHQAPSRECAERWIRRLDRNLAGGR
jgi:hypothetical protein